MTFYRITATLSLILFAIGLVMGTGASAGDPNDQNALAGITDGKALFDINLAQAEKVPLYLQVIQMTHSSLNKQGVTPDLIVAFRGPAVQFITRNRDGMEPEKGIILDKIADQVRALKALGIRFEACAVATNLFQIDNASILPEIQVVGNTFNSLIGYHAKGYAAIPIM